MERGIACCATQHIAIATLSPNLLMCINSISGRDVLLPPRSVHRPLGKGAGRYKR